MSMSDLSFEHVLCSQYTVFDGLAGMHVEDIYQDRQGFLWIATADGGVSRFDSARFDTFGLKDGLPNLTVMAIAEDRGRAAFVRHVWRWACRVRWARFSGVHH